MKLEIAIEDTMVGPLGHFSMDAKQIRIGRLPELNDLVIPHHEVSRQHAILQEKDGYFYITDMGSKNATYLGDEFGKWNKVEGDRLLPIPAHIRLGMRLILDIRHSEDSTQTFDRERMSSHPAVGKRGAAANAAESGRDGAAPSGLVLGKDTLESGAVVHQQYRIESVLGKGNFGITYLAVDIKLNLRVAIKEFFCPEFALRSERGIVRPIDAERQELYAWGLQSFLNEGRILGQVRHPHLVRVLNYFEANGTAYLVMEFEEGQNLAELITRKRVFQEYEILAILESLLDGLAVIHNTRLIHRDIKPANILLRRDGSPVLLDFGAARQSVQGDTRQDHKPITVLISPGYAPYEQYSSDPKLQGPWSDIYALAAVMYHLVTGRSPADAQKRMACHISKVQDPFRPSTLQAEGKYSLGLLQAIDHALALAPSERPVHVAAWRKELPARPVQPDPNATMVTPGTPARKPWLPPWDKIFKKLREWFMSRKNKVWR